NTNCTNTNGSYYCQCKDGFKRKTGEVNFKTVSSFSKDIHECLERKDICGLNAKCENAIPYYSCTCDDGFISTTGNKTFRHDQNATCEDINECHKGNPCGQNGLCNNTQGSYYCMCKAGFTNYGNKTARCTGENTVHHPLLNWGSSQFNINLHLQQNLKEKQTNKQICPIQVDMFKYDRSFCLELVHLLLITFSSALLNKQCKIRKSNNIYLVSELKMLVHHGPVISKRNTTLSTKHAQLDIQMEMAAGEPAYYPGFTTVSLMSYSNLEDSTDGFFDGIKPQKNQSFKINSKVVTVTVSNKNTSHLKTPVKLTLDHLIQEQQNRSWSDRGCDVVKSNPEYTVCSCNHLSSFAVLMALYEMENKFELQLITWVGLSISLIFLFISILTFSMIRSIKSTRTTIHLHLCISLFIANLVFLAGISQTAGCAVVAGILHFCYLAAFCWMCLEGIQLFRMVVLVFNTTFKTLHMMAVGYGVPAVIVIISVLANSGGYGTKRYCWLNLEIIWSFFGPVCVIIIINIFFFLITVWKLAQKFSSLNPDLDNLHKIKAFTITAVAQLCVLGIMWIFGCFQFEESTVAMSYLFTIFGSLQGVMLFIMHCLFSKQVREEYENILARFCVPQKKSYKEFNYSSKAQVSSYLCFFFLF
uniref:Si:ch211-241f5.3 n=1 Tax=Pundamilia nyererei TaxID=303518 RepID=A0A3B4FJP6_9CICH